MISSFGWMALSYCARILGSLNPSVFASSRATDKKLPAPHSGQWSVCARGEQHYAINRLGLGLSRFSGAIASHTGADNTDRASTNPAQVVNRPQHIKAAP